MPTLYHVSRANLTGISVFELEKTTGFVIVEDVYTESDFHSHKIEAYPAGLSKHGIRYLHHAFESSGPNKSFTPNELILETSFELVRKLKFPDRKSRFECTFGCLTLEDARKIRDTTFGGQGSIFKVECEKYSLADMFYLRQAGSIIGIQLFAEKYWSDERSIEPFFIGFNGESNKNIGKNRIAFNRIHFLISSTISIHSWHFS